MIGARAESLLGHGSRRRSGRDQGLSAATTPRLRRAPPPCRTPRLVRPTARRAGTPRIGLAGAHESRPEPSPATRPTEVRADLADPHLDERALRAALDVFGEKGWAGMTMDEVAARARVGKSSLYLRWPDKAGLLTQAPRGGPAGSARRRIDGTPARADTRRTPSPSRRCATTWWPTPSVAPALPRRASAWRCSGCTPRPEHTPTCSSQIREKALTQFVIEERHRVEAAIRAGELPPTASPIRILDAVEGAIFMHVLVTPPALVERVQVRHARSTSSRWSTTSSGGGLPGRAVRPGGRSVREPSPLPEADPEPAARVVPPQRAGRRDGQARAALQARRVVGHDLRRPARSTPRPGTPR